jgi:hypothetical protein
MFVMHAFGKKAGGPQSMSELDIIVERVSCVQLSSKIGGSAETVAVYMLVGVWRFRSPFRSAVTRKESQ